MPGSRTAFTRAQQLRALTIDLLELTDVLVDPPTNDTAVEQ